MQVIRSLRTRARWLLVASIALSAVGCAALGNAPGGGSAVPPAALVATIPVGRAPTFLAVAPDGAHVYAASDNTLNVIDTAGNTVMATLPINPNPTGIAVTPNGTRALITNLLAFRMTVLETTSNTLGTPIGLPTGNLAGGFGRIAVLPDGTTAWVANQVNEMLAIVRTDGSDVQRRDIDMRPFDIAFSPDGRLAYVAGCKQECVPGTVELIDTAQRLTQGYISVGTRPYRIAMAPNGAQFYTTNLGDGSLSVVDVRTQSVVASVHVGIEPTGLALARDGSVAYASSAQLGTVAAIDTATHALRGTLRVADQAREVVVTPNGRRLYVSTQDAVLAIETSAFNGGG